MEERGLLVLMVGLPRSGKSTAARSMIPHNYVIVCPDDIRKVLGCFPYDRDREPEVWAAVKLMVEALITSGHKRIILDATSINRKTRAQWLDLAADYGFDCGCWLIPTGVEECIKRAVENDQDYLLPVIDRMAANLSVENTDYITFPATPPL